AALVRNERSYQTGQGQGVVNLLPPLANRSAPEVVDHMANLMNLTLTTDQRDIYIGYLNSAVVGGNAVFNAFDGGNDTHLEERVRGLLYIMAQHPDYNFR
ncbi:MAG: hypothetical protein KDB07_08220, partial [Planctomycetes bacterium]|nr:hypothetical protein [Planctomycetota bacterium]